MLGLENAEEMAAAARLMIDIQGMLRLTIAGAYREQEAPDALRNALARAGHCKDHESLRAQLLSAQQSVQAAYNQHLADLASTG